VDNRSFRFAFLRIPGFRYCYFLRKCSYLRSKCTPLGRLRFYANKLALHRYRFKYGFEIGANTTIGPGFYLGHFGGVVISQAAILGSNVNVSQGVTIGGIFRGKRAGAPVIGNRVWIGANAVVVGGITIGDDALIAPGAYVNFDVPEAATVLGNPGKIVAYSGSAEYVNHVWGAPESSAAAVDSEEKRR
jgi:serine O-acetyltransferase